MGISDVGILADVSTAMRCKECNDSLNLLEYELNHGWQTLFRIKCHPCHLNVATFPSSRPLDKPIDQHCVDVKFRRKDMNEVTMRSLDRYLMA